MIYRPLVRGMTYVPLSATHVRALCDGRFFLEQGRDLLGAISLEPYCRQCVALELPAVPRIVVDDTVVKFACSHTAGMVKRHRRLDLEPLLQALNWGLRCPACLGPAQAANAPTDATFRVYCSCTFRSMANPLADLPAPPTPAPGVADSRH